MPRRAKRKTGPIEEWERPIIEMFEAFSRDPRLQQRGYIVMHENELEAIGKIEGFNRTFRLEQHPQDQNSHGSDKWWRVIWRTPPHA